MLGDNIYPGRRDRRGRPDDAERFRDVFTTPYGSLVERRSRRSGSTPCSAITTGRRRGTARWPRSASWRRRPRRSSWTACSIASCRRRRTARSRSSRSTRKCCSARRTVPEAVLADDAQRSSRRRTRRTGEPWAGAAGRCRAQHGRSGSRRALASSKARWKIVIGHHPLWSTAGSKFEQARVAASPDPAGAVPLRRSVPGRARAHARGCTPTTARTALPGSDVTPLPQVVSGSASQDAPTTAHSFANQLKALSAAAHAVCARPDLGLRALDVRRRPRNRAA